MKRVLLVIPMVVLLLFSFGCKAAEKIFAKPSLSPTFTCTATIAYDDFSASAQIQRYGDGVWSAEFSEPSTLSGVRLDFADGEVTASYKGLSFSVPKDAVPVKAIMTSLIEVVDSAMKAESIEGEAKDGQIIVNGTLSQGDYTITFDEKTGNLLSFEMPGFGLKMVFSNFSAGTSNMTTTSASETTVATDVTASTDTTAQTTLDPAQAQAVTTTPAA